jgi:hypothetical protein
MPVGIRAYLPKTGKTSVAWLFEGLLIVISIALGFWVAQAKEARDNREFAARVLKSLQAEVEHNVALVEPYVAYHSKWAAELARESGESGTASGIEVLRVTRPPLPANTDFFPITRRAAWDAALSTGALRLIDYDVASGLSELYRIQEILDAKIMRLDGPDVSFYDQDSRQAAVKLARWSMEGISQAEAALVAGSRTHLPAIRAAANGKR